MQNITSLAKAWFTIIMMLQCLIVSQLKPPSIERCAEIVSLAARYKSRGVVGVDIAGDELRRLDQRHIDGFRDARKLGLHVTVHAGESGPAANVRQAIEELGAERIGHGYHVVDDEEVYQLAKDKNIHFEVMLGARPCVVGSAC